MPLAHQKEKHLLRHVLGNRRRPAHLQREPVDATVPASIQERERLLVSGHHRPQQFAICRFAFQVHAPHVNGRHGYSLRKRQKFQNVLLLVLCALWESLMVLQSTKLQALSTIKPEPLAEFRGVLSQGEPIEKNLWILEPD